MKLLYWLRVHWKLWLRRHFTIASFCKECGRDVRDFDAPYEAWARIAPLIKLGTVLCYECFCDACEAAGVYYGGCWRLVALNAETKSTPPIPARPLPAPMVCGAAPCRYPECGCRQVIV